MGLSIGCVCELLKVGLEALIEAGELLQSELHPLAAREVVRVVGLHDVGRHGIGSHSRCVKRAYVLVGELLEALGLDLRVEALLECANALGCLVLIYAHRLSELFHQGLGLFQAVVLPRVEGHAEKLALRSVLMDVELEPRVVSHNDLRDGARAPMGLDRVVVKGPWQEGGAVQRKQRALHQRKAKVRRAHLVELIWEGRQAHVDDLDDILVACPLGADRERVARGGLVGGCYPALGDLAGEVAGRDPVGLEVDAGRWPLDVLCLGDALVIGHGRSHPFGVDALRAVWGVVVLLG